MSHQLADREVLEEALHPAGRGLLHVSPAEPFQEAFEPSPVGLFGPQQLVFAPQGARQAAFPCAADSLDRIMDFRLIGSHAGLVQWALLFPCCLRFLRGPVKKPAQGTGPLPQIPVLRGLFLLCPGQELPCGTLADRNLQPLAPTQVPADRDAQGLPLPFIINTLQRLHPARKPHPLSRRLFQFLFSGHLVSFSLTPHPRQAPESAIFGYAPKKVYIPW